MSTDGREDRTGHAERIGEAIARLHESWIPEPEPPEGWEARDARIQAARARDQAIADAGRRRERADLLREAGFPVIAVDAALTFGKLVSRDTLATKGAREFLRGDRRVLILAGGTGAGKTSAATWIALEHSRSAPGFVRASELEGRGRYDRGLRDWLRERSMLVVDDLGTEVLDGSGNFQSLLDEVVDLFYGDRKLVVITTNLKPKRERPSDPAQFVESYGARLASRLREVGRWVKCGDEDLRRRPS